MLDMDTFLTILYVIADDFCHSHPPKKRPGPQPSLSEGEVITLALFARWGRFSSERDFYRYAEGNLRDAFPTLPDRSQFNRLVRSHVDLLEAFVSHLAALLGARRKSLYEALDSSAMPIRDCKRRGHGWLAGCADIGWSNSLGWYEGFCLLTATEPTGVITGFCFGAASTADQQLAETFFAMRTRPNRRLISVGSAASGPYIADKGFEGAANDLRWLESYGAHIIHPPKRNSRKLTCSPKTDPVTMRVRPPLWAIRRTLNEENPPYPRADHPHAAPGRGKAGCWNPGPASSQRPRHQRGYVPPLEGSLRRDELPGSQTSQGTGERECPPEKAPCRKGVGHRDMLKEVSRGNF